MIELYHVILYVNILEETGSLAYFLLIAMVILTHLMLCAFRWEIFFLVTHSSKYTLLFYRESHHIPHIATSGPAWPVKAFDLSCP